MLIGFLILTLFVVGGTMMLNDMNTLYADEGVNLSDDDFTEVYDTMDDMYDITNNAKDDTLGGEVEEDESWSSMTKGAYSAVRLVSGSFKLFTDITNAIARKLGIPEFIITIAFIAFSISIIFGLVYMIFRFIPKVSK